MRLRSLVAMAPLWLGGCMGSGTAVPSVRLDPLRVPPPGSGALAPVAFLSGCWRSGGEEGAAVLEERWSPPEGGVMLGTSRFLRDGRVASFEFGLIRAVEGGVVYLPYPGGQASEHAFRLTAAGAGEATFEAPEHDFPKRILYRRTEDGLRARIDGGADDPEPRIWTLAAVPCHGGTGPGVPIPAEAPGGEWAATLPDRDGHW